MTLDATIAFVDLAGFTALTETHGDLEAVVTVQRFRDRVLAALPPGGRLVKTVGDAVMLAFTDADIAVGTLHHLLEVELDHDDAVLLPRAGAHHGAVVTVDDDYYGTTVNVAARVAACAEPGQLLVSDEIARAAREAGLVVTHAGARELRNVARPIDLYDIRVIEQPDVAVDPVCRMRVPMSGPDVITMSFRGDVMHFCGLLCVSRFAAQAHASRRAPTR